jgi:hypothetical protein
MTYMLIWLVELKAILQKASFSLTFWKQFSSIRDIRGMKSTVSFYPCSPIKFLIYKLEWWNPPLTSSFSCSIVRFRGHG